MDKSVEDSIQTPLELEFAVFCIENVAIRLGISGADVYELLAVKSDILQSYIVPCTDVLHTQGKDYIVEDILGVMRERGILERFCIMALLPKLLLRISFIPERKWISEWGFTLLLTLSRQ